MKREIIVTVTREATVKVTIDDSVITEDILKTIDENFVGLKERDDWECPQCLEEDEDEDKVHKDVLLYNYAKYAALHELGDESEFITLNKEHTETEFIYKVIEVEFDE